MLKINDVELDFELFDADTLEVYEKAFEKVGEQNTRFEGAEKTSDILRASCVAVKECFDSIFGEGIGVQVCGEKPNFMKHTDAFEALVDEAVCQRKKLDARAAQNKKKYVGNRTQRRADKN